MEVCVAGRVRAWSFAYGIKHRQDGVRWWDREGTRTGKTAGTGPHRQSPRVVIDHDSVIDALAVRRARTGHWLLCEMGGSDWERDTELLNDPTCQESPIHPAFFDRVAVANAYTATTARAEPFAVSAVLSNPDNFPSSQTICRLLYRRRATNVLLDQSTLQCNAHLQHIQLLSDAYSQPY